MAFVAVGLLVQTSETAPEAAEGAASGGVGSEPEAIVPPDPEPAAAEEAPAVEGADAANDGVTAPDAGAAGDGAVLPSEDVPEGTDGGSPTVPEAGGTLVFASHMPDTSRLLVRCERARAEGTMEVVVPDADPGNCTVTAVDARRGRRVAVIASPERRRYECFRGGENACE